VTRSARTLLVRGAVSASLLAGLAFVVDAGAVNVIYSNADERLSAVDNQLWHQNSPGVWGWCEASDRFGSALATGDFDWGWEDLAIGVPGESINGLPDAGAVNVFYSFHSAGRLKADNNHMLNQE